MKLKFISPAKWNFLPFGPLLGAPRGPFAVPSASGRLSSSGRPEVEGEEERQTNSTRATNAAPLGQTAARL